MTILTSSAGVYKASQVKSSIISVVSALLIIALIATIGHQSAEDYITISYTSFATSSLATFRACFGTLIAIFAGAQLYVAVKLYNNRHNSLIELFQPVGLSLFAIAGGVATLTCFLFALPEYDISCILRQPIIFICISFMGSILMTRSWRISSMIGGPRLSQDGGLVISQNRIGTMRLKLMNLLSKLSQWGNFICSCGRHKGGTSSGIRKQITFADSMRVTMILMIPQIVLQIINVSVPSTRVHSVEIDNGIYVCQSDTGIWLLIVGAVLAVLPFFLSLLLNVKSIGIPDQFREYEEISSSMISSISILIITLPTANMIRGIIPTVYTYLTAASVLSFRAMCYNISYTKMNSSVIMDDIKRQKPHSSSSSSSGEDDLELIKRAEDITTMASMFDTIGQTSKALDIDRDILSLFKKDKEKFTWEMGYTSSEISSLGPKSLEVVVSTLIKSSKRWDKIYIAIQPGSWPLKF